MHATHTTTPLAGAQQSTGSDIAVGVPMYIRERALTNLLDSVPEYVSTVYVADNGPDQDRDCYAREWPFDVDVLHLPVDCGIGQCRAAITDALEERYLWLGDCDMEFVREDDPRILRSVLERNPDLGGVAGWLVEDDVVRAGARDLAVHGDTVVKTAAEPDVECGPVPFSRWEFIPQCALFRSECFDAYDYDPDMADSEHVDFFYGHKQSDWEFASTPAVMTKHNRNINKAYRNSERGTDHASLELLHEKWGFSNIAPGTRPDWGFVRGRSLPEQAFDVFRRAAPPRVWIPTKRTLEGVLK
jgi:hypothetical protein